MAIHIRRREFIFSLGSAVLAPAAGAQQGKRLHRVAFLHPYAENDPEVLVRMVAFRQGLEALGWKESRNIRIEHQYCGGDLGKIQAYTTEAVRSAPDLIAASSVPIVAALKQATDTIPIVAFSRIHSARVSARPYRVLEVTSPVSPSSTFR